MELIWFYWLKKTDLVDHKLLLHRPDDKTLVHCSKVKSGNKRFSLHVRLTPTVAFFISTSICSKNKNFSSKKRLKGITEWPNFWMETSKCKCSPGFNSWSNFSLVYINDICSNLSTNVKLIADDTSLFSIVMMQINLFKI